MAFSRKVVNRGNGWTCGVCTLQNSGQSKYCEACEMCQTKRSPNNEATAAKRRRVDSPPRYAAADQLDVSDSCEELDFVAIQHHTLGSNGILSGLIDERRRQARFNFGERRRQSIIELSDSE